jgi:hypothetical protein
MRPSVRAAGVRFRPLVAALLATFRAPAFLPLFVFGAALAYFGAGLGAREVSLLEAQDLSFASQLFQSYRLSADHSPLHFALLGLWAHSGGVSVALLRLPSAICVAAAAVAVFRLGARVAGPLAGACAALLFTTNPEIIDQARSLRLYGFALLWCALSLERAHAFGFGARREAALYGFLVSALLAVHTHLFLWLWVAPLAALCAVRAFVVFSGAARRRVLIAATVATVLAIPQVVHGVTALGFTHERHAVYAGVSNHFGSFLREVGWHLAFGESDAELHPRAFVLVILAALPCLGVACLRPKTRALALVALVPPFVAAFCLSLTSEVEARYLCFALPGLAVLAGVGLAALPVLAAAPAALAVVATSVAVSLGAYGEPATDWYAGANRLEQLAGEDAVVAVFPGYWADTFRFYTPRRELVAVTYPADLERVLARGRRVLLVLNGGRYSGDLDAYLAAFAERRFLFRTEVRDQFEVDEVRFVAPLVAAPAHAPASAVFAGLVGGGGYAWLDEPNADAAFEQLQGLFASADLAVTGYAPYTPPWPSRLLLGPEQSARLEPQLGVARALARSGARAVAISSERGDSASAAAALASAPLAVIPSVAERGTPSPVFYALGTERLALFALGTTAATAPTSRAPALVSAARARLRPSDGLVVFVPLPPRFDALPTTPERAAARRLVDAGADVVIGNGSYAAQPLERYHGGVIAYALGSLVVPPTLDLAQREATGIALRVEFAGGRPIHVEALPTTFDDRAEPRLGRLDGVPADIPAEFAEAFADLGHARAWLTFPDDAPPRSLEYRPAATESSLESWVEREARDFIPWTSRGTSPEPFAAGFFDGRSFAGVRGVRSFGQVGAALEIDAAPNTTFNVELPRVTLGTSLEVDYALPDDRELSKYRPLLDENVCIGIEDGPTFSDVVTFRSGWHHRTLDTRTIAHGARHVTLAVSSPASHFPIAFQLHVTP